MIMDIVAEFEKLSELIDECFHLKECEKLAEAHKQIEKIRKEIGV